MRTVPEHPIAPASARLASIDALRGAAAIAVVLYHTSRRVVSTDMFSLGGLLTVPFKFGELGVTLFLVISGFCIHMGTAGRMARGEPSTFGWLDFWKRRFFRLYPPYLVAIAFSLAMFALAWRLGEPPQRIVDFPWDLATHLLLVHNLFPAYAGGLGDPPFWSLGLEEQLYALYAVYLALRRRTSARRTAWIACGVTLAWVFATAGLERATLGERPLQLGMWAIWPFAYWFYWVLGAIAAEAHAGAIALPAWCYRLWVAAAFATLGVVTNTHTLGDVAYSGRVTALDPSGLVGVFLKTATYLSIPAFAVAFFVVVNVMVRADVAGRLRSPIVRWLAPIGLISYSLYMVHYPVIQVLDLALRLPGGPAGAAARYLIYVPASLAVALVFFLVVERRFLLGTSGKKRHLFC